MTAPTSSDPRVEGWLDPSLPFASTPTNWVTQINDTWTNSRSVRSVPEPGILGESGIYTFARVADPDRPQQWAYLHRIKPGWAQWQGTNRSSIAQAQKVPPSEQFPGGITLVAGVDYWMAFGFRMSSDCSVGATAFSVFDVHHDNWTLGSFVGVRAPIQIMALPGGTYLFDLWGCLTPNYSLSQVVNNNTTYAWRPNEWHYWVVKMRLATSWSDAPFISAWRAVNDGPLTLEVSRTDFPLGYSDAYRQGYYVKPGLYYWYNLDAQRTLHSKGCYVLRAESGATAITESSMLELLRGDATHPPIEPVPLASSLVTWTARSGTSAVAWHGPDSNLVTPVERDYESTYNSGGTVSADYSASYAISGLSAQADFTATYAISGVVERDYSATWGGQWTRVPRDVEVWIRVPRGT